MRVCVCIIDRSTNPRAYSSELKSNSRVKKFRDTNIFRIDAVLRQEFFIVSRILRVFLPRGNKLVFFYAKFLSDIVVEH